MTGRNMNKLDELKLLRLQEEKQYISTDFIEGLARELLDELVRWANGEIFAPRGGELTFAITLGPPNAGVAVSPTRPFHPRMEFRSSLISDMYADAFTFPIVCYQISEDTEALKSFNETERFSGVPVQFAGPLPELHSSNVAALFRPACEALAEQHLSRKRDGWTPQKEDVRCRFIMFELMLVWTFFHELGHAVQGHYRMHSTGRSSVSGWDFLEMDEPASVGADHADVAPAVSGNTSPDLPAQARELMADAEATDLTLKYLVLRNRLTFNVWYLLLCSMGCMFQRFYASYPDNLEVSHARHPHPVIRDETSQLLCMNWVADYLVANKNVSRREESAMSLTYLGVRASLMTGLFRSSRIEKRDESNGLPSYMGLITNTEGQWRSYLMALLPEIEWQLAVALDHHLIELNSLKYWFEYVKAAANTAGLVGSNSDAPKS